MNPTLKTIITVVAVVAAYNLYKKNNLPGASMLP